MERFSNKNAFVFEKGLMDEIEQMEVLDFKQGTIILKEKQFIKVIPLVLEGSIKLRKVDANGREIVFYHVESGESCILSITSCLNEKESQAEAIITRDTRIVAIEADTVRRWMDSFSSWRKFVVNLYYNRMAELMTLIDLITFKSVDERLYKYIHANAVDNKLMKTHQELAGEIGTAREVVSRLLKQMEVDEIIRTERGLIIIL